MCVCVCVHLLRCQRVGQDLGFVLSEARTYAQAEVCEIIHVRLSGVQEEWSRLGRPGSRSSRGSSSHRKVASRPGSAASSTASQWVARELARIDPQSKNAKLVPLGSFNVRSKDSSKSKGNMTNV